MSRGEDRRIYWLDVALKGWGVDQRRLRRDKHRSTIVISADGRRLVLRAGDGPLADLMTQFKHAARIDGFGPSITGRLDEPIGHGTAGDPPSALRGNSLLVSVAIKRALDRRRLTEKQLAVIYLHYDERFFGVEIDDKAFGIGVKRRRYYQLLYAAQRNVAKNWPEDLEARMIEQAMG